VNTTPQPNSRSGASARVLLNKSAAAQFLGIAQRTLDDWRKAGSIACIERPGYIRFLLTDLEAFLEKHRREAKVATPFRPRRPITTHPSV
jgi:hypothetical protein